MRPPPPETRLPGRSQPVNTPSAGAVGRDRYRLRVRLFRGGMGEVWEALDTLLDRIVAVKLLPGEGRQPLVEARLTAGLEHPNIVPVHDAGVDPDGTAWYAMRLVRGRTMRQLLDERPDWPPDRWAAWVLQLAGVLGYAHDRGVVHRDVKPENIVVGGFGEVYLLDWGIALGAVSGGGARASDAEVLDAPGPASGSPGYRAPEQFDGRGDLIGPATDVWALGALLWEMLEGERYADAARSPPRTPRRGRERRFRAVLSAALAGEPADRPRDARVFAELLRAELEGENRRSEARAWLARASEQAARWEAAEAQLRASEAEEARIAAATPTWAPWSQKGELLVARRAADEVRRRRATDLSGALADAERALGLDPSLEGAQDLVARAWLARLDAAERAEDEEAATFARERVRAWGGERWAARLEPLVEVRVRTGPAPVVVTARRWREDELLWTLADEPERVGVPSGADTLLALPPGRWRIEGRAGEPAAVTSIRVTRDAAPVQLDLEPRPPMPGMCFVSGGPFVPGGDPGAGFQLAPVPTVVAPFHLSTTPVTLRDYLAFLAELPEDEARARAPRNDQGRERFSVPLLGQVGGRWVVPERDRDGDRWEEHFPVFGVSWDDARAYARWMGRRVGAALRLPTEIEWEYAARTSDGRRFPWGNEFDPSLCRMAGSTPGRPQPCAVGSYPTDQSPFGVLDLAGLVREWCDDAHFEGDPLRRPVRGGCWNGSERLCRAANRYGYAAGRVDPSVGFRLACSVA